MSNRIHLGELLMRERRISLTQLKAAQDEQRRSGRNLTHALAKLGYVSEQELANFIGHQYGVPSVDLGGLSLDPALGRLLTREVCEKYRVVPVSRAGATLIVALSDPTDLNAIDAVRFLSNSNVEPVVAGESAIAAAIERMFPGEVVADGIDELLDAEFWHGDEEEEVNAVELARQSEDAPVVKLCNAILLRAAKDGASDVHVEPYEKKLRVRYRIDGVLREETPPPLKMKNAIASRLKIMAGLDIAERRLPQDGRIRLKAPGGREMDYRVSVLPTIWGEKIVMRLLDKSNLQLDMTRLGFEKQALEWFMKAIRSPFGMVLVTGPTGSGKTTTLYSALSELNKVSENISTAEDPVEYNLPGINQCQMHDDIGLNFAAALRSFLRQDPDVIMVGEIRDFETAEIGVKAALTGHMVLSTLHTNDAPSTVSRLLNMGIEPFMVTAATTLVVAQRLARRVCPECRQEVRVDAATLRELGFRDEEIARADGRLWKGAGCGNCNGTGYRGRVALYEVMPMWDELKELVLQGASAAELKTRAVRCGMRTLRMSGISRCLEGVTTTEELIRVTLSDVNRPAG